MTASRRFAALSSDKWLTFEQTLKPPGSRTLQARVARIVDFAHTARTNGRKNFIRPSFSPGWSGIRVSKLSLTH